MINSIITPMNFTLVRDYICQNLRDVRDNQKELAANSGAAEDFINQVIDFTIFPKRFRFPSVDDMPCVFVYFDEMNFPENEQDIYENNANGNLIIEYYAAGMNDENNEADENAEDRLNYLTAQIYKILCSEPTNIYKSTQGLVNHFAVKTWKRISTPESDNMAATVLGARFEFDVGFGEPTHYENTTEIKEFYIKANIGEENIDPFVRYVIKED